MPRYQPVSKLTASLLLFPLALVLFEFATYISHDMIQPGMLLVTQEFGFGPEWVSTSLTAYLLGGVVPVGLLGPLSDKYGLRPVMLAGILFCYTRLRADDLGQLNPGVSRAALCSGHQPLLYRRSELCRRSGGVRRGAGAACSGSSPC